MQFYRTMLAALALSLPALAAPAQEASAALRHYPRTSLGLTLGWGAPYGWGIDASRLLTRKLDVNAGVGASITGTKAGMGTSYYFAPEHRVSPFFGASLVHSGGRKDVHVTEAHRVFDHTFTSSEEAHINFRSTNLLHLRSGLRWQPTPRLGVLSTLGYGFVLGDDPIEYLEEPARQSLRDAVRVQSPGGVELSVSLVLALSRRQ